MSILIRPETDADYEAIREVNRLAFGQDAEAGFVDGLRAGGFVRLSLIAEVGGVVLGHILFSRLQIITKTGEVEALALTPMAVVRHINGVVLGRGSWKKGCGPVEKPDTESCWCWGTLVSTHGSGFRLRLRCPWLRPLAAASRGWRSSWCRVRWRAW